jgi:beclin 1
VQSHYALEVNNASLVFRFGPVNLFWSTRFDKAMTWFLTCLQEFAEFAINLDKENNVPFDKSLKLPYK